MLSSPVPASLSPTRILDRLLRLDGAEITVDRRIRDLDLPDRFAALIEAVVNENVDRRTRIAAGVTSAGRTRINAEHAVRIAGHAATLEAVLAEMRRTGIEIALAVELFPNADCASTGPVRLGSIGLQPRTLVTTP